jgi:hypothetical protein
MMMIRKVDRAIRLFLRDESIQNLESIFSVLDSPIHLALQPNAWMNLTVPSRHIPSTKRTFQFPTTGRERDCQLQLQSRGRNEFTYVRDYIQQR